MGINTDKIGGTGKMSQKRIRIIFFLLLFVSMFTSCFKREETVEVVKTCVMVMQESDNSKEATDEITEMVFDKIEEVLTQRNDLRIIDYNQISEILIQDTVINPTTDMFPQNLEFDADLLCIVTVYNESYKVEFLNSQTSQKKTFTGQFKVSLMSKEIKVKDLERLKTLDLEEL